MKSCTLSDFTSHFSHILQFQKVTQVLCRQDYILIASNQYPASVVKSKLLKLNYFHIEYVLECLHRNTTKVTNIRKYLLAVLFNAPSTMDVYYLVAVQHDMPQLAIAKELQVQQAEKDRY